MTNITFEYEIIRVDEGARCMEVVYRSEGRPTMNIGARLPFQGETLESIIQAFAPIQYWIELETPLDVPVVGTAGTIVPKVVPPASVPVDTVAINDQILNISDADLQKYFPETI